VSKGVAAHARPGCTVSLSSSSRRDHGRDREPSGPPPALTPAAGRTPSAEVTTALATVVATVVGNSGPVASSAVGPAREARARYQTSNPDLSPWTLPSTLDLAEGGLAWRVELSEVWDRMTDALFLL